MIYLNQAATSWPKPEAVEQAVQAAIALPPSSQYRSAIMGESKDIVELCRKKLAKLFSIEDEKNIFFTSGATDSFNRIIRGLNPDGQRVIVTQNEHNAVLRPLYNIYKDLNIDIVACDEKGCLLYDKLEKKLSKETKAVFINHCSNVTGAMVDLEKVSGIVHKTSALLIVDASQTAGHVEINVESLGIDIMVFTGHKGLSGPQGTGGFYVRPGISLMPAVYGGTGYDSKRIIMEDSSKDFEVGTLNSHGLRGLCAGVDFILETGIAAIESKERQLVSYIIQSLSAMDNVIVYGDKSGKGTAVSFNIKGLLPADVAYILAENHNIIVRSGYHCAPLIHEAIGTDGNGTVRVSVSYFNTMAETQQFIDAIRQLEQSV